MVRWPGVRTALVGGALLASVSLPLLTGTDSAHADARADSRSDARPGSRSDRTDSPPEPRSQSAYLAERLRENPVYVSDALPRTVPRSAAPAFTEQARRTGVPTYVLVLPDGATDARDGGLLAAVHDRLGKRGLYVLLDGTGGSVETSAHGVDVPAKDAAMATQFELPYDAGPLDSFTRFVDVLRSGKATERADAALEKSRAGDEPDQLYTSRSDREEQSALAGALTAGVPLLLLGAGWYVRRWRGGRGPGPLVLAPVAAGTAVLLAVGASWAYGDTRSDGDPPPTARDMAARGERVADGLRRTPVYADPEGAPALSPRERRSLAQRAAGLDVPVYLAVVPVATEDESGGDADLLAQRLHKELGKDGVYVIAPPGEQDGIHVVNYGAKLDDEKLYGYAEDLRYTSGDDDPDPLADRLDALLRQIGRTPSGPPGEPYLPPTPAEDPVEEDALPSVYSGDMAGGAALGALGAAGGFGLTAAGLGLARHAAAGRRSSARGAADGAPDAPARPSLGWLRRTARRELGELGEAFGAATATATDSASDRLPDATRQRVWDCLDAATLLLDQEGDSVVDEDADVPTLATGLALLRAGSAVLAGSGTRHLCALNPLHGPAAAQHKFTWPAADRAASYPVCAGCRAALGGGGGTGTRRDTTRRDTVARDRVLRLAPTDEPYDRVPGPLGVRRGVTIDQLISRVREQLGVH